MSTLVLHQRLIERPEALRAEPTPALAPVLAPAVMRRRAKADRKPIASSPPWSASRASTTSVTLGTSQSIHEGRAAVPTRAITLAAGIPAASSARRSKPPSTRMSGPPACGSASKPNQPAGLVLIQRLAAPGWSRSSLCAFSSMPGSHLSSVRPIKPCPKGEDSGKRMRSPHRCRKPVFFGHEGMSDIVGGR